jgi:hypothetical protein
VSQELREAVHELHQFLSDRIAPLMFADSMAVLLSQPSATVARAIGAWCTEQQAAAPNVPVSDFLYHAAQKVSHMGALELVPREQLGIYLRELGQTILAACPEGERDLLKQNLDRLGQVTKSTDITHVAQLQGRPTQAPPSPAPPPGPSRAAPTGIVQSGLRRLGIFLDRLRPQAAADTQQEEAGAAAEQRAEVASQFVADAAGQATTAKELEQHLAPLREYGIDPAMDKILRTLARTLPGWGSVATGGKQALVGAQLSAMRKIVAMAEDPAEGGKRFRELVQAAIEQFNEGNLGRAVTMFGLAQQLADEGKVQPAFVDALRQGHEPLHYERLRKCAERVDLRPGLRTVMNFYYALRPEGLLKALNGEPKRERRHELLALLEAHEEETRSKALELLKASVQDPANAAPFFQMNLVYLLRVIARPKDGSVEEEVSVVMKTTARDSPPPLVKQVIAYLGYTRHDKSERALVTFLRLFEGMLLQPEISSYAPAEVETLLDRTCAALARYASPRAWRALIDHGLKTEVKLGSPTARLVEAGRQDLSSSPDLVERLIVALKAELAPKNVLGLFRKNDERIIWLVQALAGTATPEVRAALEDIGQRFPTEAFGVAASKAVLTLGAGSQPAPPAGLAGDLELFGLPGLLQTLGQSALTGVLSLMNAQGKTEAMILIEQGQFRGAQYGGLRAAHAVYQLFERPFPGTFAFVSRADIASAGPTSPPRDVIGVILEGVRRHDEFRRAATLVPDNAVLSLTDIPPSPLPDEDPQLVRLAWNKIGEGGTPAQVEAAIARDCYHVRRLVAHWVEEGALEFSH